MGVWVKSKSTVQLIRDGMGFGAPMITVTTGEPVYLVELDAEMFAKDRGIVVMHGMPAPTDPAIVKRIEARAKKIKEAEELKVKKRALFEEQKKATLKKRALDAVKVASATDKAKEREKQIREEKRIAKAKMQAVVEARIKERAK